MIIDTYILWDAWRRYKVSGALFHDPVISHKHSLTSMTSMSMKMLFPEKNPNLYLKHHAQSNTSYRFTYGQDLQDLQDGAAHLISCQSC